ncbi:MAG: DUF1674 domain-containing protein [Stenotrophobium sp.]
MVFIASGRLILSHYAATSTSNGSDFPVSTPERPDTQRAPLPETAAGKAVQLADLLKQLQSESNPSTESVPSTAGEIGGRKDGPEPTRYGDWEKNGRCIDF